MEIGDIVKFNDTTICKIKGIGKIRSISKGWLKYPYSLTYIEDNTVCYAVFSLAELSEPTEEEVAMAVLGGLV